MRALLNGFVNALLVCVPFLGVEAAFQLLPVSKPPRIQPVSAEAPVAHFQPNVDYVYSRDWDFSARTRKRSNNFGYIHQADYHPNDATPLLMVIGDSYVEAHAIAEGKSVAERLHSTVDGTGRVYSLGLSGAALSQYLVFAEFAKKTFRPGAMAFIIIANDFDESLLKYQSEPRLHHFTDKGELQRFDYEMSKTRRILRQSAFLRYLVLHLEPARTLQAIRLAARGHDDALLEQRALDSERAIDFFLGQLPSYSGLGSESIVFILDAVRPAIYLPAAALTPGATHDFRMRRYFASQARARGYEVLDMEPVFIARYRRDGSRFEVAASDGHWNALGHQLAAEEIQKSGAYARVFRNGSVAARGQ